MTRHLGQSCKSLTMILSLYHVLKILKKLVIYKERDFFFRRKWIKMLSMAIKV